MTAYSALPRVERVGTVRRCYCGGFMSDSSQGSGKLFLKSASTFLSMGPGPSPVAMVSIPQVDLRAGQPWHLCLRCRTEIRAVSFTDRIRTAGVPPARAPFVKVHKVRAELEASIVVKGMWRRVVQLWWHPEGGGRHRPANLQQARSCPFPFPSVIQDSCVITRCDAAAMYTATCETCLSRAQHAWHGLPLR